MNQPQLTGVAVKRAAGVDVRQFPYSVPVIAALQSLTFRSQVCFFVGENGSGKSTLLEALAAAASLPAVGSNSIESDDTLAAQRRLGRNLRLSWARVTHRGFFLRAEDFFGFAKELSRLRLDALRQIEEVEREYDAAGRSELARKLAAGPHRSSLMEMESRYGVNLDANSHGQSFLRLFQSRFVPDGLYLMDEPEAPLSPQSQLAFLAMVHEAVGKGGQFIIATHSPILLAYPGAQIVSFDSVPAAEVEYDQLEHVNLTRDFLRSPARYLNRIIGECE